MREAKGSPGDPAWGDEIEERIEALVGAMSLREKVRQLHGLGQMRAPRNRRLGIPDFRVCDGPHGIGEAVWRFLFRHVDRATCFPVSAVLAAAWDPELARRVAAAVAREAIAKGRNWLLAPCINIVRDPRAGRTQECYGEDPHLASRLAVAYVRGAQDAGVIATPKHFACHNQESDDGDRTVDVRVSERALREIYLPAFQAAVTEGGALAVMTARHTVNGDRGPENARLLGEVLRGEWGFQGIVISDWKTVRNARASIEAGLDVEMPKGLHYRQHLEQLVESGEIPEETIDAAVRRVLRVKLRAGLFGRSQRKLRGVVDSPEHRRLALEAARAGLVLLRNRDALLPLSPERLGSLAVIGPSARVARLGDDGSSEVRPFHRASPLAGLRDRLGSLVKVRFAQGCPLVDAAGEGKVEAAAALATQADAAVVCVGLGASLEGEGADRRGNRLALPGDQDRLIQAVAAANPATVVVTLAGGAVAMHRWIGRVAAVVHACYPGQEGGLAIADLLLGRSEPEGRLPMTFPRTEEQLPGHPRFPEEPVTAYEEGIFVGYRHFDRHGLEPLFPFGHGLSYTQFAYRDLAISGEPGGDAPRIEITLRVANVGERPGAEVVQLYLGNPEARLPRPPRELKGFRKIRLDPGEEEPVRFELGRSDLSYWDEEAGGWVLEPGRFHVEVGSSSRDVRLRGAFRLTP